MKATIFLGFLFSVVQAGSASIWHVSPKSLPSARRDHQFQTIQEAADKVAPGDVVIIDSGTYRETVVIQKGGTPKKPIRFETSLGANVVVTGLDRLTEWRKESEGTYSTAWPYRFIPNSKTDAHPDDEYHRLIGRAEQVVINGQALQQTLQREQMSSGSFYVDLSNKRLYVSPRGDEDAADSKVQIEAATRSLLWDCKGDYVYVRGIHFRYGANPAQRDGVVFRGRGDRAEDCIFERMNAAGAAFVGKDQIARRCTFQDNGQLGFAVNHAHNFLLTDCTDRNNNIKGFNTQWEAGGTKVVLSRGVVFEKSRFIANHGPGVWFDIGCENGTVRNCLIADNEDAGIFYEISFGLNAHDNVVVGNGFASDPPAWGAQAGIVLSSSPDCVITRNLIVGNREGFNFREQERITQRIDHPDPAYQKRIWNHDEQIRNNVIAYNQDAQTRGWFGVSDQRHWPRKLQEAKPEGAAAPVEGISLEALHLDCSHNLYAHEDNEPLFIWGTSWLRHVDYPTISAIQSALNLEQGSTVLQIDFHSNAERDFRLPPDSPVFRMKCYPQGGVPDVRLGKLKIDTRKSRKQERGQLKAEKRTR